MGSLLNVPGSSSGASTFNSGIPFAEVKKKRIKGLLFADSGVTFNATDMASVSAFNTALQTKVNATRGSRVYPMYNLFNFEDKTGEPNKGSTGNLTTQQIVISDPIPSMDFGHSLGEVFQSMLIQLETGSYDVFFIDEGNCIFGTQVNGNLKGFGIYQVYVNSGKFLGQDAVNQYKFSLELNSFDEFRDLAGFFQGNTATASITGLRPVTPAKVSIVTNTLKISFTGSGGKDCATLFATQLAQVGAHVVKTAAGVAVTVTSPTLDTTTSPVSISMTLGGTPWSGAVTGDNFTYDLAVPATLYGLSTPLAGVESTGPVAFQKP